jgi:hypothetical protein
MGRLVAIQEAVLWVRLGIYGEPLNECLGHAQDLHQVLSDYEEELGLLAFRGRRALDEHRWIGAQIDAAITALAWKQADFDSPPGGRLS